MENNKIKKTNKEWREKLSSEQYHILREGGTDKPFTGKYYKEKGSGIFCCAACGKKLFDSNAKYDSGSGWPSFFEEISDGAVKGKVDHSLSEVRTEAICPRCESHLGHIFEDGPEPTGKRYCINSTALKMERREE